MPPVPKHPKTLAWRGGQAGAGFLASIQKPAPARLIRPDRCNGLRNRFAGRPKTSGLLAFGVPPQGRKHALQDYEPARLWPKEFAERASAKNSYARFGSFSHPLAGLLMRALCLCARWARLLNTNPSKPDSISILLMFIVSCIEQETSRLQKIFFIAYNYRRDGKTFENRFTASRNSAVASYKVIFPHVPTSPDADSEFGVVCRALFPLYRPSRQGRSSPARSKAFHRARPTLTAGGSSRGRSGQRHPQGRNYQPTKNFNDIHSAV